MEYKNIEEIVDDIIGKNINHNKGEEESKKGEEESKKEIIERYIERAYDIRKFELDLYWKRGSYFWGFIAASFTAYFIVLKENRPYNLFLILCIGFIFSLSWYLVNRGSTYWTSHYERLIDALESYLDKNFYKINLKNENSIFAIDKYYPHSVSRINLIVSFFICLIWFGLICNFLYKSIKSGICEYNSCIDIKITLLFILTLIFSYYLIFQTESDKIHHGITRYRFYKRDTKYSK